MAQQPQQNAVVPIDRETANNALTMAQGTSVAQFVPTDFSGLMTVADLMSKSGSAIAKHLRQNPGACLSVAMTAYQNGFNPWLLANDSYIVNDQLAYGGKSIIAMVNNSPKLNGRLHYVFSGDWPKRKLVVSGYVKGDDREKSVEVDAEKITVRNSPLWKQQPDQQLRYYGGRMWARAHMPEVTLGLLAEDDVPEMERQPDGSYAVPGAPPRPTRGSVATGEADDQPVDRGPVFDLVDHVGEIVEEDLSPGAWVDAYADRLRRLTDQARATFVENNADAWESIRAGGLVDNADDHHRELHPAEEAPGQQDDGYPDFGNTGGELPLDDQDDGPAPGSPEWAIDWISRCEVPAALTSAVDMIRKDYWKEWSEEDQRRVSRAKVEKMRALGMDTGGR